MDSHVLDRWMLKYEGIGSTSLRELISWIPAVADCQEKNTPSQYTRINLQDLPKSINQKQDEHFLYKIEIENTLAHWNHWVGEANCRGNKFCRKDEDEEAT